MRIDLYYICTASGRDSESVQFPTLHCVHCSIKLSSYFNLVPDPTILNFELTVPTTSHTSLSLKYTLSTSLLYSATPEPKSTKMSASAPVFVPKADDLDAESSANAAAVAAAVAKSRVTRPLPNSRRQAPGADFVPKQAVVPKSVEAKENTRRLIVVLSQVSPSER
jgi:hypothetical protein